MSCRQAIRWGLCLVAAGVVVAGFAAGRCCAVVGVEFR